MGHEMCGRVRNPSPESGLKDGDAVMVDPRILCQTCKCCTSGRSYGCEKMAILGSHAGGGFAERCAVEERMLHKLPDNCPLEYAAIIEPLAVVQHAIRMTRLTDWENKDILVIGGGPIGLAMIMVLKAHGAKRIIVSEPTAARRKQVLELTDHAVDPVKDDVVARCEELTEGRGIDIVFDCAGVPAGLESGSQALKLGGTYMNVAVWAQPVSLFGRSCGHELLTLDFSRQLVIPVEKFMWKDITMKSTFRISDEAFRDTMSMMGEGKFVGYEKLVTGRIGLEQIVQQGFEELINHKDEHIKILVSTKM